MRPRASAAQQCASQHTLAKPSGPCSPPPPRPPQEGPPIGLTPGTLPRSSWPRRRPWRGTPRGRASPTTRAGRTRAAAPSAWPPPGSPCGRRSRLGASSPPLSLSLGSALGPALGGQLRHFGYCVVVGGGFQYCGHLLGGVAWNLAESGLKPDQNCLTSPRFGRFRSKCGEHLAQIWPEAACMAWARPGLGDLLSRCRSDLARLLQHGRLRRNVWLDTLWPGLALGLSRPHVPGLDFLPVLASSAVAKCGPDRANFGRSSPDEALFCSSARSSVGRVPDVDLKGSS